MVDSEGGFLHTEQPHLHGGLHFHIHDVAGHRTSFGKDGLDGFRFHSLHPPDVLRRPVVPILTITLPLMPSISRTPCVGPLAPRAGSE
jgi:hypothetical protein